LSAIATGSPELKRLLAQHKQFSQIISAKSQPAEKASQLLQLLQPAGEVVFAPASAALDWADRCAAQTQ